MQALERLRAAKNKLRKNVSTFLNSEDASIGKQALLGLGVVVIASSLIGSVRAGIEHSNLGRASMDGNYAVAEHQHHSSHSTHSTHGTHSTHASHSTHGTHSTHASHSTHSTHANCCVDCYEGAQPYGYSCEEDGDCITYVEYCQIGYSLEAGSLCFSLSCGRISWYTADATKCETCDGVGNPGPCGTWTC